MKVPTSPEFWLNLQTLYELRLAEERVGKTIRNVPTLKRRKVGRIVTGASQTGSAR
jgi:antitoxin HigA-1